MKNTQTKVRFAPSPTGLLHLGGMRSALFNWLYARKTAGQYILRLEDTDRERYVPEAVEQIKASHLWLGLDPDDVLVQSDRLDIYQKFSKQLLSTGDLYRCWCSAERLSRLREEAQSKHQAFKYDRYCLENPQDSDKPHVLRFRIPDQPSTISWQDAVRGQLSYRLVDLDDFIAIKSDGYPTYNFANVVDDHDMGITHVLRAEEFLPSTPKHLLIYDAFNWPPPVFAHLPQVLGRSGSKKLSKREGAKSVLDYRDEGYLPDAIINFLALLGWNEGEGTTQEVYTRNELTRAFSLERIQKSPAVFDEERLDWMNGLYIRQMTPDELLAASRPFWAVSADFPDDYCKSVLSLVQERLKKLSELDEQTAFFFADPEITPSLFHFRQLTPTAATGYLQSALKLLKDAPDHFFDHSKLEASLRQLVQNEKPVNLFMSLRIAITGQLATPPLFQTMTVLGHQRVVTRIEAALRSLQI